MSAGSVRQISLDGESLTPAQLADIADSDVTVALAARAVPLVEASRAVVDRHARDDRPMYGINTGFGALAETIIPRGDLQQLQLNLLRSHAAGVGEPLPARAVRATMALRANVLAKGFSGIRRDTIEHLLALLNRRVHPVVPSRGSVGASGDLAPLAHISLVLIGEGFATVGEDDHGCGREARRSRPPVSVRSRSKRKRGWRSSTARSPRRLLPRWRWWPPSGWRAPSDIAVALSIDALRGSVHPFEARIHEPRPYAGQRISAANVRVLLEGSAINKSHEHCGRVQDAYSLRCAAQVHGAARDALGFVAQTLAVEANAATDNPMVFAADDEIVSGGNFHGAPVAIAADLLAIAAVQFATISERRADRLVNPVLSELPAFLTPNSGLQSGYMMAQVTAAALASELKTLAHPASADTIPTSANREDHVSMSMGAALKAERAVALATRVVADRDPVRVPGARFVDAAQNVATSAARARSCSRRGAAARRRSSAGARHRSDRATDRRRRAGGSLLRRSQIKKFSVSV